jgi:hypothetical protein
MQDRYLKARVPRALYEALLARSGEAGQRPGLGVRASGSGLPFDQRSRWVHLSPPPSMVAITLLQSSPHPDTRHNAAFDLPRSVVNGQIPKAGPRLASRPLATNHHHRQR